MVEDAKIIEPRTTSSKQIWQGKTRQTVAFAIVLGLLALLALGLVKASNGPRERGVAPDFSLAGFDGRTVKLSNLRGQVVIINFWASWCPPCREEAAYPEQTWRKYKDKGIIFVGVDWVDTKKEALAYIKEFDITYINGPDIGTQIADDYRIRGVPETFYGARNGELRGVHIGPLQSSNLFCNNCGTSLPVIKSSAKMEGSS